MEEMKKEPILIEELKKFDIFPYDGEENHVYADKRIDEFVQLMVNKGYCKEDVLVSWGECMGIKLEAKERGNEEKFESPEFQNKFQGEVTLIRAVCYLLRRLSTADMELYYFAWLHALRNVQLPKKKVIRIEELCRFDVQPYVGNENYAPEHPDIVAFVKLMLSKGYSKDELIIAWGECMGIKLEAHERGNEEKFDDAKFHPKFTGEMTLLRAVCYLFRRLLTIEMNVYYRVWLNAVWNAEVPEAPETK